ncbi:MAG TPA: hypothetical protein PKE69_09915 [Pyrinomonadaceae bacterium]|nr:hypothetical protein [Pyrinomonadaceae bacterium]
MENFYINHLAVLVCAVMSLVIGGLWWSPVLFAKTDESGKIIRLDICFGVSRFV